MNSKAQTALVKEIVEIASKASRDPVNDFHRGISWGSDDQLLTLPETVAFSFFDFARKLARLRPWSERVSEAYVKERLVPILRAARDSGADAATRLFEELVDDVESYSVERTVYVPIDSLHLEVDELQIGQVMLKMVDDNFIEGMEDLLEPIASDPSPAKERRDLAARPIEEVRKRLGGKVVAEYRTVAEPIRARERAEEETRRALELITYANAALHPFDVRADAVATLEGELPRLRPWIPVLAPGEFHTYLSRTPTSLAIPLTGAVLERFETVGFWSLTDCLARPSRDLSDFDQTLLRAVHWFAASQTQTELENRLLNLITCLEALVGPKDRAPISASVAEAVAIIVAKGFENRRSVKKFLTDLYGARSGISHGGAKAATEYDVKELRWIVTTLLTTLIRWRECVQTRDELLEWLERARLSGEPVDPPSKTGARKLTELRETHGWTQGELARKVGRPGVDASLIEQWEQWKPAPSAADLRFLSTALGVRPEKIALPPRERWTRVRGYLFHLTAHRKGSGTWTARVTGYDSTDAVEWPVRPVDPDNRVGNSPAIIATNNWQATSYTADKALSDLSARVVAAMERALKRERLPEEPSDWQPPEVPRHWKQHLEAQRLRRLSS